MPESSYPIAPIPVLPFPLHDPFPIGDQGPSAILPISNRQLLRIEVEALARLYWPEREVQNAVQIALQESGFWTGAANLDGEDSRGLWQINLEAHPHLQTWNLFDPQINAYFAHVIWQEAEGWTPWLNAAKKLGLI